MLAPHVCAVDELVRAVVADRASASAARPRADSRRSSRPTQRRGAESPPGGLLVLSAVPARAVSLCLSPFVSFGADAPRARSMVRGDHGSSTRNAQMTTCQTVIASRQSVRTVAAKDDSGPLDQFAANRFARSS